MSAAYKEALFLVCTVCGLQVCSFLPVLSYQMFSRDSLCLELCQVLCTVLDRHCSCFCGGVCVPKEETAAKSPHSEIFKSQVHKTLGIVLSFEKPSCFLEEFIRKVSTGVAMRLNWGREQRTFAT